MTQLTRGGSPRVPLGCAMPYMLKPGISYCIVDGRCFFIDRDGDRYFTVSPRLNAFFLANRHDSRSCDDAAAVRDLEKLGLLQSTSDSMPIAPFSLRSPVRVFATGSTSWRLTAETFRAYCAAARRIKSDALRGAGALLAHARAHRRKPALIDASAIAASFGRAKRFIGDHDRCLPWSVAIGGCLLRHGHDADVVLGICPQPFTAHCWVQSGDSLVCDDLDRVAMFTPILAL